MYKSVISASFRVDFKFVSFWKFNKHHLWFPKNNVTKNQIIYYVYLCRWYHLFEIIKETWIWINLWTCSFEYKLSNFWNLENSQMEKFSIYQTYSIQPTLSFLCKLPPQVFFTQCFGQSICEVFPGVENNISSCILYSLLSVFCETCMAYFVNFSFY